MFRCTLLVAAEKTKIIELAVVKLAPVKLNYIQET